LCRPSTEDYHFVPGFMECSREDCSDLSCTAGDDYFHVLFCLEYVAVSLIFSDNLNHSYNVLVEFVEILRRDPVLRVL
jgi:hypothetical protein